MICYYFPPLLDVGCKRSVAFAKYLKLHGWEPHVLSVRNPDKHYCRLGNDSPPSGIPVNYAWSIVNVYWLYGKLNGLCNKITKFFNKELTKNYFHILFSIPDLFFGWIPGATISGRNIIKDKKINYIYVSCSPFSSAIVGIILKKITNKKLIIDFRDPFAIFVSDIFKLPKFRVAANKWIEKKIINNADLFIVNTEEVRDGYVAEYNGIDDKTFVLHNGFDHALMPKVKYEKFHKFTIVYGGNMYFYANKSLAFFEAISLLKENSLINKNNFQFQYYGNDGVAINSISKRLNISDLVFVNKSVSHEEMIDILLKSHAQLLRIVKPMISTKMFEGIALNVPFVATIPDGEVANLIKKYSPSSCIIESDCPKMICKSILKIISEYQDGLVKDNLVKDFIEIFSREKISLQLEALITKL